MFNKGPRSPLDSVICMYMAQLPYDKPNIDWQPIIPASPVGNPGGTVFVEGTSDLEALLTAIFALKGGTAEIFKLKAQAFSIKAKLTNDGQQDS